MPQRAEGVGLLGYGCMRWPTVQGEDGRQHIDQQEVNRLVDYALEHGVNYFDTSPAYLEGDSERATAEALNRYPRDRWLLATKLSNFSDASYDNSVLMYRRSLEIFNTDHIDYYLLHSISGEGAFDQRFGSTGIMDFLLKERELGHIRNLGFSFHGSDSGFDELMTLHDKYHWDFVQIQMNYVDWTHAGRGNANAEYMYGELDRRGIPIIIMEPLRGGRLADLPAGVSDRMKAREPEKSLASWAFRFAASFPRVICVLSGMTYMEHLQDNVSTFLGLEELTDEEKAFLESVAEQMENYPLVGCTACQYCMPLRHQHPRDIQVLQRHRECRHLCDGQGAGRLRKAQTPLPARLRQGHTHRAPGRPLHQLRQMRRSLPPAHRNPPRTAPHRPLHRKPQAGNPVRAERVTERRPGEAGRKGWRRGGSEA